MAIDNDQSGTQRGDANPPPSGDRDLDHERELVERAQAGDRRAFAQLYRLHHQAVFRCAMSVVRNRDLAEDIMSDTFVRAYRNLERFEWQGRGISPWFNRIAKNRSLDHMRKAKRMTYYPEGFEQQIPDTSDSDAEELLGRAELSDVLEGRIARVLAQLNPRYRRVIELRIIEKRPRKEVAEVFEVKLGTLDVLLFRACKAFRKVYADQFGAEDDGQDA